jgi:hypothetical protein
MPEARIELVGPIHAGPPSPLPANIRLSPPCPHSETGKHLARFSAGLIPFKKNILTAGVDPVKFYDYRAAGLPVLTTTFGEMALRKNEPGVFFLDRSGDLTATVRRAVEHRDEPAETARFRRTNDWRQRFVIRSPFATLLDERTKKKAA